MAGNQYYRCSVTFKSWVVLATALYVCSPLWASTASPATDQRPNIIFIMADDLGYGDLGLRTPMIVRWPGKIKAGSVSNVPWYFPDVLPTLAEIAGIKARQSIDGLSVLPSLLSQPQDLSERRLYWEFFENGFQQAMRWRHWKVIRQAPARHSNSTICETILEKPKTSQPLTRTWSPPWKPA